MPAVPVRSSAAAANAAVIFRLNFIKYLPFFADSSVAVIHFNYSKSEVICIFIFLNQL